MSAPRLPEHLELLLTDEPLLDVYSHGPWRVPDGLYDEVRERALEFDRDERAKELTSGLSDFYGAGTSAAGAELWSLLTFLLGASAIRAGSRGDIDYELFATFLAKPEAPVRDPHAWFSQGGRLRPPGLWLVENVGDDADRRATVYTLAREALDVLAGIEPVEKRRRAMIDLYDRRAADPDTRAADLTTPQGELERLWATDLPADTLAALPELAGPVGYLGWVCSGWLAAHERLLSAVPGHDPVDVALARLLLQAEVSAIPAELAFAVGVERYQSVQEHHQRLSEGFRVESWQAEVRSWLARGLVAGEADVCRAWLDMALRITGCVQGLPESAVSPKCRVPVRGFQMDLRRLFQAPTVVNPLAAAFAGPAPAEESRVAAVAEEVADDVVGQPDLVTAVTDGAARRPGPARTPAGQRPGGDRQGHRRPYAGERPDGARRRARDGLGLRPGLRQPARQRHDPVLPGPRPRVPGGPAPGHRRARPHPGLRQLRHGVRRGAAPCARTPPEAARRSCCAAPAATGGSSTPTRRCTSTSASPVRRTSARTRTRSCSAAPSPAAR